MLLDGLETKRLRFRNMLESDADFWETFFLDPDSVRYFPAVNSPRFSAEDIVQSQLRRYQNDHMGLYTLIVKESGAIAGFCGPLIQFIGNTREVEIGYHLMPEFRKNGYATEAAFACRNFLFANDICPTVISIIHRENEPSKKVALRNGMNMEKESVFKNIPVEIFRVSKPDF